MSSITVGANNVMRAGMSNRNVAPSADSIKGKVRVQREYEQDPNKSKTEKDLNYRGIVLSVYNWDDRRNCDDATVEDVRGYLESYDSGYPQLANFLLKELDEKSLIGKSPSLTVIMGDYLKLKGVTPGSAGYVMSNIGFDAQNSTQMKPLRMALIYAWAQVNNRSDILNLFRALEKLGNGVCFPSYYMTDSEEMANKKLKLQEEILNKMEKITEKAAKQEVDNPDKGMLNVIVPLIYLGIGYIITKQ